MLRGAEIIVGLASPSHEAPRGEIEEFDIQSFEGLNVKKWAECYIALMLRSSQAKIEFANMVDNPMLKTILTIVANDHKKIADVMKLVFGIEEVKSDVFSKECQEALGKAVLDRIKKAISLARKLLIESKSEEDVNKLCETLLEIHDIAKGALEAIANIANEPTSTILRHLASTIRSSADLVNNLVRKALLKGAQHE
ncbi:MAG: hypothetical protein DRJ60_01465 [Thermoprotei archaeon]|nr:MAG: hypothetical protein DRJ60_01465 [Thermoprotei archaeon]